MTIQEKRQHVSILVRMEGFEDFMKKIKNKYIHSHAMKEAILRVE